MAVRLFMNHRTVSFMVALAITANVIGASAGKRIFSHLREAEIQRRLEQLNKPAVKSIQSPDGDTIDCVTITNQPAFDHPLLQNHTIQMRPSSYPEGAGFTSDKSSLKTGKQPDAIAQLWNINGECPEDTIPIRRTTREDLLRADSIENYGKKSSKTIHQPKLRTTGLGPGHEYAVVSVDGEFHGAKAHINLWKPKVVRNELSTSQIWIGSGDFDTDLNTLEAGWEVALGVYTDDNPKFFIYWTRDSYRSTGCYNLRCPGFVQVNRAIALGVSISPISTYAGSQSEIKLFIWKDSNTGNWWLKYGNTDVGYWPSALVPNLADRATEINWGGEILNIQKELHTTTEMGSGHFAEEGFGKASFFSNIQIVDTSDTVRDPKGLDVLITRPSCYDLKKGSSKTWGTYFYYGGPGRNLRCL